jgi:phosphoserine phosphatase RsbU/P
MFTIMLGLNPLRLLMVAEQFADIRWIGEAFPTDGGWEVQSAHRLSDVARLVAEGVVLDALLIFSTQANESLSDSCERLASQFPRMAIVLITEEESDSFALSAIRLGVQDCFTRMESERIDLPRTIRFAVERQRRQAEVQNEKARDLSERVKELGGSTRPP